MATRSRLHGLRHPREHLAPVSPTGPEPWSLPAMCISMVCLIKATGARSSARLSQGVPAYGSKSLRAALRDQAVAREPSSIQVSGHGCTSMVEPAQLCSAVAGGGADALGSPDDQSICWYVRCAVLQWGQGHPHLHTS